MKAVTRLRISAAVVATLAIHFGTLVYADHHSDSASATHAPTVLITGANRGLGLEFAR